MGTFAKEPSLESILEIGFLFMLLSGLGTLASNGFSKFKRGE